MEYSILSKELTSKLSKVEKKDNGIYFTPPSCVHNNLQLLHPYMSTVSNVLEPSCGSGEYLGALKALCSSQRPRTPLCLSHAIDDIPILISVECKARDMPARPALRAIPGTPGIR